ncbi:outer membrane protein transport protein [Shewanella sp.]|nr:outer membrane protein transport protein [Shewanella sp.]
MKYFNKTLIAASVAVVSTQTMAAGFQLNSQSATGVGRAFAGDAVIADNASVLSRNPAAMALFDKQQLSMGLTYADVEVDVSDVFIRSQNPLIGEVHYGSDPDAADAKLIPNFYYVNPVNDKFAYGVALFSNFGTGTDTAALSNPQPILGGTASIPAPVDLLGETEVTTINLNLSASYRINEHLSIGAGLDVVYGKGTLTRKGDIPSPSGQFAPIDLTDVDADGYSVGGIIGAMYEINDNHRFGMSYRFSPDFKASGDINLVDPRVGTVAFDEINIPLPDIFQVAGFHQLTNKFALHYTAQLTTWGDFHEISVIDGSSNGATIVPKQSLKTYAWDDSWLFSIGGTYSVNNDWTLRAGYMHDQGVVGEVSSISIPDSDRQWYTMGATYTLSQHSSIDFGIAFIRGEETQLTEHSSVLEAYGQAVPPLGSEIATVHATTLSNATYYSLQYNHTF